MELIGVFLVFGGCHETIIAPLLSLQTFFQAWMIIHVSLILEHFLMIKFMWPLIANDDNNLATHCHHWFFFKRRREHKKEKQKKELKKKKSKKETKIKNKKKIREIL